MEWRLASDGWSGLPFHSFRRTGVTVSNNFTKRRQIAFKIGTRDKLATHLRKENFISNEIVIYTILFTIGDSPIQFSIYTSCRIHHLF